MKRALGACLCSLVVALLACSGDDSSGSAGGGGGAGGTASSTHVTITGNDQGKAALTDTITGDDYSGGNGVSCRISTLGGANHLRIDAQKGSGFETRVLLQLFDLKLSQKERDEDFTPPPQMNASFVLSADIIPTRNEFFFYDDPSDWVTHLAANPACHTRFSSLGLGSKIKGQTTCTNLFNEKGPSVSDLIIDFECPDTPY